jgi:hydrogenase-4 component B
MINPALGVGAVVIVRAAVVVVALLLRRRRELVRRVAFGGAALASAIAGFTAAATLGSSAALRGVFFVHHASGFSLSYSIDPLSAWFLIVLSILAVPIAIFSIGYARHPPLDGRSVFLGIAFNVLLFSVELVFIAGDVIAFLFAWELMTLSTAALVATEYEIAQTRGAAYLYLVMSHVGTGSLIAAFFILASASESVSFSTLLSGGLLSGPLRDFVFLLFFIGFGVKAGIIPLHIWLPEAHPAAPSGISALMSGVLIKTGIYGIVRFCAFGLGTPPLSWGVIVLVVGALSAVLGVLYALMQHDLKRLLAYHSIENIGIIVMGIGLAVVGRATHEHLLVVLGLGAAVLHVWNHAVFKALLFLSAGAVVRATGTRDIDRMGGLGRALPWSAALFTLGAVAICGLPPLNGFASELILYLGAFESLQAPSVRLGALVAPVLAVIGALACACFVKVVGGVFLGTPRDHTVQPGPEAGWAMRAPMLVLASLCVALGVAPAIAFPAVDAAVASWMGQPGGGLPPLRALTPFPALGIIVAMVAAVAAGLWWVLARAARGTQVVGTWDCGYVQITSRMQYTSSSFGRTLVDLLHPILHGHRRDPVVAGAFPERSAFRLHVGDLVLDRWVLPLVERFADRCSRLRTRQALRIQMYIVYIVAATAGLLLLLIDLGAP